MRPARGASRMPSQANPAEGNPNSMPHIAACSKSLVEGRAWALRTQNCHEPYTAPTLGESYCRPSQNSHWWVAPKSSIMRLPSGCSDITPSATTDQSPPGLPAFTKFAQ